MAATILHALGIDPATTLHTPLGRPVELAGGGKPVTELFSVNRSNRSHKSYRTYVTYWTYVTYFMGGSHHELNAHAGVVVASPRCATRVWSSGPLS